MRLSIPENNPPHPLPLSLKGEGGRSPLLYLGLSRTHSPLTAAFNTWVNPEYERDLICLDGVLDDIRHISTITKNIEVVCDHPFYPDGTAAIIKLMPKSIIHN